MPPWLNSCAEPSRAEQDADALVRAWHTLDRLSAEDRRDVRARYAAFSARPRDAAVGDLAGP